MFKKNYDRKIIIPKATIKNDPARQMADFAIELFNDELEDDKTREAFKKKVYQYYQELMQSSLGVRVKVANNPRG